MKTTIASIGIDVAKATLSIAFHSHNGSEKVLSIRNSNTDMHRRILPKLKAFKGKIVMESTGHYHWTPALILSEAGYDVYVVNPLLAKQYVSGSVRKIKSDPADAGALARMARVADNLPQPFTSTPESLWLRKKLGLLASLSKQVQALKACLNSVKEAQAMVHGTASSSIVELENTLLTFGKQMKSLEDECVAGMKKNEKCNERMKLLVTIPGISEFGATLFLHWFDMSKGATAMSWVAYAGIDVSVRESGTWKGTCRLTKRGNAYLRKRLFSSAWGAWQNDDDFHKYYSELKEQGRPHVEILTIISRKLIRIAFSVLDNGLPYDASLCFGNGK